MRPWQIKMSRKPPEPVKLPVYGVMTCLQAQQTTGTTSGGKPGGEKMLVVCSTCSKKSLTNYCCDDCVMAGQNVFLRLTSHLPRPEYCLESDLPHLMFVKQFFFKIVFSKRAVVAKYSPRSGFAVTFVGSCPEDSVFNLIANSILGAAIMSMAVKIAFWIMSSTVSAILLIPLSIFSLKYLSKIFTVTVFSLLTKILPEVKFYQ